MIRHLFLQRPKGALAIATFFAIALASMMPATPGHAATTAVAATR